MREFHLTPRASLHPSVLMNRWPGSAFTQYSQSFQVQPRYFPNPAQFSNTFPYHCSPIGQMGINMQNQYSSQSTPFSIRTPSSSAPFNHIIAKSRNMESSDITPRTLPVVSTSTPINNTNFKRPKDARILSRNSNGTVTMTSQPSNESELQLYRVLQRANLLAYYDTFICQGGDDVQQLCEAGEEEFLEIMALVGMATKPLHVRRLQKSLQEWLANPSQFLQPLIPIYPGQTVPGPSVTTSIVTPSLTSTVASTKTVSITSAPLPSTRTALLALPPALPSTERNSSSTRSVSPSLLTKPMPTTASSTSNSSSSIGSVCSIPTQVHATLNPIATTPTLQMTTLKRPSPISLCTVSHSSSVGLTGPIQPSALLPQLGCTSTNSIPAGITAATAISGHGLSNALSTTQILDVACTPLLRTIPSMLNTSSPTPAIRDGQLSPHSHTDYTTNNSPLCITPILLTSEIQKLSEAAAKLIQSFTPLEAKLNVPSKKRISKELEYVMNMVEEDPRRMDEIRKYAAIYGRFDCKRKPEKPLTMHEVYVNEAAAQLCRQMPALLTRRDELFPLARRVVKDSGYQYSKGHSRSQFSLTRFDDSMANHSSNSNASNTSTTGVLDKEITMNKTCNEGDMEELNVSESDIAGVESDEGPKNGHCTPSNAKRMRFSGTGNEYSEYCDKKTSQESSLQSSPRSSTVKDQSDSEEKPADSDDTDSESSVYSNQSSPSNVHKLNYSSSLEDIEKDSISSIDHHLRNGSAKMKTKLSRKRKLDQMLLQVKENGLNKNNNFGADSYMNSQYGVDLRISASKQIE